MSSKIKQDQYYLWRSIIPQLQKNINQCIKQIKQKPIYINPPQHLQHKINKIKIIFQQDILFDEEEFFDVIAFFIQQKVNITLLELADLFSMTFGKDNNFWTPKITHWANMQTFTNSLIIWNVNQFMRNFINYSSSPLERDFIYQWRQKVQAYLSSLEFLMRKIQRLKMSDNSYFIDDSYLKYHKEKMLYITFVSKFGMKNNNEDSKMSYHDDVTVTFQNKTKAEKKLFNFPHATRTIDDMSNFTSKHRPLNKKPTSTTNTLQKYNFIKPRNIPQQQFIDSNIQRQRQQRHKQQVVYNLSMIGKMSTHSMKQLREQLIGMKVQYRQQLMRQDERIEYRLREHVVKLTAKKNRPIRKQKQNKKQQQKEKQQKQQMKQHQQFQSMQQSSQRQTNKDTKHQPMQIEQIIQQPLPLYYQVVEQQSIEEDEYRRFPMSHATFIHNPLDYYSFQGRPIGDRNIPVNNPFAMYPWVNYYINDREEYEELMAVSLGEVSVLDDEDDSQEDSELQEGEENSDQSNFIDTRAIITSDNVDWDKLPAEDKMKFDQLVDQNKLRWVADYKNENSRQLLSRFESIPIYGTELPYMITGIDKRTKRKGVSSKQKQLQQNAQQVDLLGQIVESPQQEECSMTMTMMMNNKNNKIMELVNEQTSFEESKMVFQKEVVVVNEDAQKGIDKKQPQSNKKTSSIQTTTQSKNEQISR